MNCPICNGVAKFITKKERQVKFRKDYFTVFESYYECSGCKEKFVDSDTGGKNIEQVHNQYREKYGLMFPVEIIELREKYSLSKIKMSLILGWGENTYSNYEKGAIPNESHNSLMRLIIDPNQFLKLAENKNDLFNKHEKEELIKRITKLLSDVNKTDWINVFWPQKIKSDTGYSKPSFDKFIHMVIFFLTGERLFKTKLNKLLFYSDFYNYRNHCRSLSGARYRAIDFGPVPSDYEVIYNWLIKKDLINVREDLKDFGVCESITANINFDKNLFNEKELEILEYVKKKFKRFSVKQMKDYSHKELAWKENEKNRKIIDYQRYAFRLN